MKQGDNDQDPRESPKLHTEGEAKKISRSLSVHDDRTKDRHVDGLNRKYKTDNVVDNPNILHSQDKQQSNLGGPTIQIRYSGNSNLSTSPSSSTDFDLGSFEPRGGNLCIFGTYLTSNGQKETRPQVNEKIFPKTPLVKSVACHENHFLALTGDGKVYSWGDGTNGKLGHGNDTFQPQPLLIQALKNHVIVQVSCGPSHSSALTDTGKVMVWGLTAVPPEIEAKHITIPTEMNMSLQNKSVEKCIKISSGDVHMAIIDMSRRVYYWAWANYPSPVTKIEIPIQYLARDLCSGPHFTSVLTDDNKVYTKIFQEKLKRISTIYKLIPDQHPRRHPGVMEESIPKRDGLSEANRHVQSISCGIHNLTILLENGLLLLIDLTAPPSEKSLLDVSKINLIKISCGFRHLAGISKAGTLYTWGIGNDGALGHDNKDNKNVPTVVLKLSGTICELVSCTSEYTIVITNYWATVILRAANGDIEETSFQGIRKFLNSLNAKDFCYISKLVTEAYQSVNSQKIRKKHKVPEIQISQTFLEFNLNEVKCPIKREIWDRLTVFNRSSKPIKFEVNIWNFDESRVKFNWQGIEITKRLQCELKAGDRIDLIACLFVRCPPDVNVVIEIIIMNEIKSAFYVCSKLKSEDFVSPDLEINFSELIFENKFEGVYNVYRALYHGAPVAVKRFPPHMIESGEFLEDVQREISVMSKLHHPYILNMIGACLRPCICIVSELMFTDLFHALHETDRHLSLEIRVKWGLAIAWGMEYLHSKQIIHRDLKSSNVLINKADEIKICDFGQSRYYDTSMTLSVGTPFWKAPEVLRHQEYGFPADVYSYAVVLWELSMRKKPYSNFDNVHIVTTKITDEDYRMSVDECLPLGIGNFIVQCWDSDPTKRPDFLKITEKMQNIYIGVSTE